MTNHTPIGIKYLKEELQEKYQNFVSPFKDTLKGLNKEGYQHPESHIGINVGDADSYEYFKDYFEPILQELHPDFEMNSEENFDKSYLEGKTNSYRVRLARNIKGFPLPCSMDASQRRELFQLVKTAIDELSLDYKLCDYEKDNNRVSDLPPWYFFGKGDSFYDTSGLNRDWPIGRAVFYFPKISSVIWVGEEDHLRIFCHQEEGNFLQTYENANTLATQLEEKLGFYHSKKLSYLTTCPSNLGTGMRISIHYKLAQEISLESVTKSAKLLNLSIRGTHGERSDSLGGIIDISNSYRHGNDPGALFDSTWSSICRLIESLEQLNQSIS
ncbi:hypothetical protein MJH12_02240 [bacterium]|nr:hypothetical protein [bacterium]